MTVDEMEGVVGRTRRPSKQLVTQNLNWIEPIQRLGLRAKRHSLVLVSFAKTP
jgi:hypothetical protein